MKKLERAARFIASNGHTRVLVLDQPDQLAGNACHEYAIVDTEGNILQEVTFQHGPTQEFGVNGVQHVDLLAIIQHRLDCFQGGRFASPVNEVTSGFVGAAIANENTRTRRRTLAGVEGTNCKAVGVEK